MVLRILYIVLVIFQLISCTTNSQNTTELPELEKEQTIQEVIIQQVVKALVVTNNNKIKTRFPAFGDYKRQKLDSNTYAFYLQNLSLKPFNEQVKYHNGAIKPSEGVYISVVNMKIGKRDLQQCADAVMRLRAEYLYKQKEYQNIHFNFLSDGKPRYFNKYAKGDYSYKKFTKYMDYIFSYANTGSLIKELQKVEKINDIRIGDVFIQKGNPYGHAITVVDILINSKSEKLIMLAQSYMPAQETQILINPNNENLSPWYELKNEDNELYTPEWSFIYSDLRRFKN